EFARPRRDLEQRSGQLWRHEYRSWGDPSTHNSSKATPQKIQPQGKFYAQFPQHAASPCSSRGAWRRRKGGIEVCLFLVPLLALVFFSSTITKVQPFAFISWGF